ncbi:MAG: aminotransferase [Lysobacterales bacterium]|jgi:alanine-synthesizing transaminase|nr:MAG: aminotransferase [Xanthomonadales bacterium]
MNLTPSPRLSGIRYEIRGELAHRARALEAEGRRIIRLNIGNPGLYGFRTPAHLREAVERHLGESEAYCHEQGLMEAREAVAEQARARGIAEVSPERVFIGNGVSELIDLALRALLDFGDEVLVPSPDYPLWTAAVGLNGGRAVHYPCRPENAFLPDPEEVERLVSPRTRALVLIQPNNPTGAVYPRELLAALVAIARRHRLVLMSDEIYDGLLFDGASFVPAASLAPDLVTVSLGGLSKVHRACGYRVGWLVLGGPEALARDYDRALDLLAALRLCSNVPAQWAVAPALRGPDTASALTAPGGRLYASRQAVLEAVEKSAFLELVRPMGALYAFPRVRSERFADFDDHAFALRLLEEEGVLLVPGTSFNFPRKDHFRITLLPEAETLREVFARIEALLVRMAGERSTSRRAALV